MSDLSLDIDLEEDFTPLEDIEDLSPHSTPTVRCAVARCRCGARVVDCQSLKHFDCPICGSVYLGQDCTECGYVRNDTPDPSRVTTPCPAIGILAEREQQAAKEETR